MSTVVRTSPKDIENHWPTEVRDCVGDLGHPTLWCTSGIAEFRSLTLDERKRLLEVAIDEGRRANPDVAYIQTPMMEAHGGEGVLRFYKYIASRTDIAMSR
jgi:4-hydroxy-tetrahydrodipicolinate synthase